MNRLRQWIKHQRALRGALYGAENLLHAIRPQSLRPLHVTRPSEFFLSAMIRVKDEARFMPEWIAHHLQIGVEHVFIYDNNSTDALEDVLTPFVARSLVTIVKWPNTPAAPSCNYHFLRNFGGRTAWVSFFDADEFLIEKEPGITLRLLTDQWNCPALAINWRYYGSSGYERVPLGLVTENFILADRRQNQHVKVIAQPPFITKWRSAHNFLYRGGRLARNIDGRRVLGSFSDPPDDPQLVLNHYVYRSREDFERKARRSYGTARGAALNIRRAERAEKEFYRHNEKVFVAPCHVTAKTKATLRELGYGEPFLTERLPEGARLELDLG